MVNSSVPIILKGVLKKLKKNQNKTVLGRVMKKGSEAPVPIVPQNLVLLKFQ